MSGVVGDIPILLNPGTLSRHTILMGRSLQCQMDKLQSLLLIEEIVRSRLRDPVVRAAVTEEGTETLCDPKSQGLINLEVRWQASV